jgi:multiple sugar transport system permease protein
MVDNARLMAESVPSESSLRRSFELSNLRFALIVSIPVLLFLLLVVAYPLAYALYLSFNQIQFFGGYSAEWAGFSNYVNVVKDGDFWSSLQLTLLFSFETVVLTLAVGMTLALILRRLPKGWRWLRAVIILPWAVSPYGAGIFFGYLGRGQTGLGTALASATINLISDRYVMAYLALGAAWNMGPLVAFFLLANMLTIPARLYDLARIDRMTPLETFWNVTLPPLRFTLFVFTCITTVLAMKTFDYIFTETQGGPGSASSVLTYTLYKISFVNLDLGYGAAMSFFLLAVIIISTGMIYLLWGRREERR